MKYLDCISVGNMRESDRMTIEKYVSGRTLMYRAAMGIYRAMNRETDRGQRVLCKMGRVTWRTL